MSFCHNTRPQRVFTSSAHPHVLRSERKRERMRQERRDIVRTLLLFRSSSQTDRMQKRFPKMPLWIVSLQESFSKVARTKMIRRRSSEQCFEAFEELEPPALINPLCLWTMALFFFCSCRVFHLTRAKMFPDSTQSYTTIRFPLR